MAKIKPKFTIVAQRPKIQSTNLQHFGIKKVQSISFAGQIYSLQKGWYPPCLLRPGTEDQDLARGAGGTLLARVESKLFLWQVISLCRKKFQFFQFFWQFFQVFGHFIHAIGNFLKFFGNFFKILATFSSFSSLAPSAVKSWIQPCTLQQSKLSFVCSVNKKLKGGCGAKWYCPTM